jgi:enamine deaminase RidA (YjgF/YER057c/UK114 family)
MRPILTEVRSRYLASDKPPASTLVGVQSLALEGLLVEVEAVAVTD